MRTVSSRHRMNDAKEEWLIELYHGDESGFLGIAASDTTFDGSRYLGVIAQTPSISQELDLREMRAIQSISDLVLTNVRYLDGWLHEELTGENGRIYANRKVIVRSVLNGSTDDDVIFTGKMSTLSHDKDEISLRVASFNPAKGVRFPQARTARGNMFPVVLGVFGGNVSSTPTSKGFLGGFARFWPAQVDMASISNVFALYHQDLTTEADQRLHFYEPSPDGFCPLVNDDESYSSLDINYNGSGLNAGYVKPTLYRAFKIKPSGVSSSSVNDFTDAENMCDGDKAYESSTYGYATCTIPSYPNLETLNVTLSPPRIATKISGGQYVVWVKFRLSYTDLNWNTISRAFTVNGEYIATTATTSVQTASVTITAENLNDLEFEWWQQATPGGTYPTSVEVQIIDVVIELKAELDVENDDITAIEQAIDNTDTLYCGASGLTRSWTTGASQEIHEHHRELLIRFAGMATTTPSGFSALDTAHASWDARAWWNETVLLTEVLAKMQREGQFIFDWTAAGLPWYLYVASSYSSGDVDATIVDGVDTEDWIKYEYTDPSDLVSDHTILYQPHPADSSRYLAEETKTNADRSDWAFATEENKIETKLDWLVNGVDEYADAVDQLWGTVRQFGSFSTTRPLFFVLERGDILQIEDNDRYFMVTRLEMEPGVRDVTMMEVYRP